MKKDGQKCKFRCFFANYNFALRKSCFGIIDLQCAHQSFQDLSRKWFPNGRRLELTQLT